MWDLAGQDVHALSHSVHFFHRCMYVLLWKPDETLDVTMRRISPWLESLCMHVPDAHIVLVASHCKTNITDGAFLEVSSQVQRDAEGKVEELNEITRLEVDKLRTLLHEAQQATIQLVNEYKGNIRSLPDMTLQRYVFVQEDRAFLQNHDHLQHSSREWGARAAAACDDLPYYMRGCAASVLDACEQEVLLRTRLQRLLGIRDGGPPDGRDACKLTLRCHSVDSVCGHGVAAPRNGLYYHCASLLFIGEMISTNWMDVVNVFEHLGDAVLSRASALALVRQHLPQLARLMSLSDAALWSIIEFWSDVGRVFVYESQVAREPKTLIALLKPLLHHKPLETMQSHQHQHLVAPASLSSDGARNELEGLLRRLQTDDELSLQLLSHLIAWRDLTTDQRNSLLAFFERSRFMCRIEQRPDLRLISARIRSKNHLSQNQNFQQVTATAKYRALYLLPANHIGLVARVHSAVSALSLKAVKLECQSARDSLIVHRSFDMNCACVFSVEEYSACVQLSERFSSLHDLHGEKFSCVFRISSTDFGMFKFAAACADEAMDSCSFGFRFQCWSTVVHSSPPRSPRLLLPLPPFLPPPPPTWILFRDSQSSSLSRGTLAHALGQYLHLDIVPGPSIIQYFRPRSCIFVSHAWGDGTGEFIKRLKTHLEQQTLASVWVDDTGLNQEQETIVPSCREALCQARIVFVLLTPTHLTRSNCLRELQWALDFETAGHVKVALLSLHPAVTFKWRQQLVQAGPLQGLVFSSKENTVKRLK